MTQFSMEIREVNQPVSEAGWYLGLGYGIKPMVLYAVRGQTVWREGCRQVPITEYAGPLPDEKMRKRK